MKFLTFFIISISLLGNSYSKENCLPIIKKNQTASDYNYLIAKGIFNEFLLSYMTFYSKHLVKLGVPKAQIKTVSNYSAAIPQDSARYLKKAILSFNNDKKTVVLSHSKGALESLYMLIKHKDIRESVHKIVLLQGPLQGVSSYQLTYGKVGEKVASKSWSFYFYRKITQAPFISKRFKNFSKEVVSKYFNYDLLMKEDLLDKLIFVRTYKNFESLNWKMKYLGGLYANTMKINSDGVIAYIEQLPEAINTENACVLDLYADHGDLVKTSLIGGSKKKRRIGSYLNHLLFNDPLIKELLDFESSSN